MQQGLKRYITVLLYAAGTVGAVWLSVRFLLPWAAPFLVAYAIAALLERPVRALVRRRWRRTAASGLLTLSVLALAVWGTVALALKGVSAAADFARQAPELMAEVSEGLKALEQRAFDYAGSAPEAAQDYLRTAIVSVSDSLSALPALLSRFVLDLLTKTAQTSPDALLFTVTAGIGTYFISSAFPRINAFILAQLPDGFRRRLEGLGQSLRGSFGGFLRSQFILMAMTFFELLLGFLLLGVEGAAGLAAVTAIVDALPVFGTGIVLAPWAVGCVLTGDIRRGVGLLVCWAAVSLVRSCTQAKLLGDQIGLDPVASLAAIYVGWRVWRVWGMLLFPIILVTLRQLNEMGVIQLWKRI